MSSLELRAQEVAFSMKWLKCFRIKINCLKEPQASGPRFSFLIFSLESFDASGRIDQFLLACEERMALGTDFQVDFRLR